MHDAEILAAPQNPALELAQNKFGPAQLPHNSSFTSQLKLTNLSHKSSTPHCPVRDSGQQAPANMVNPTQGVVGCGYSISATVASSKQAFRLPITC